MKIKLITYFLLITFFSCGNVFAFGFLEQLQKAQENSIASQLPQEAMKHIQTAQELMMQASNTLSQDPNDRSNIEAAIGFYASAGEHFENASKIFETMGPGAIPESDLAGVKDAIQACVDSVARLKDRLNNL